MLLLYFDEHCIGITLIIFLPMLLFQNDSVPSMTEMKVTCVFYQFYIRI